ncbi:NUDIX domain-containing protein [Candidatus Dojkabacteria bacterium]|nr:NUDIX domain-containing protein [Candidatus Dojkabacteria bacterium]
MELRVTIENPYHLSVGAVVFDGSKIAIIYKKQQLYTLPRETIYANESLESALSRGMQEELGVKVEVVKYLGSITRAFSIENKQIQKTTLYFICNKTDDSRKSLEQDEEKDLVLWLPVEKARELLHDDNADRSNEYRIIDRLKSVT